MEEEIINSLIQLGAATVITYLIYLIINSILKFRSNGKNEDGKNEKGDTKKKTMEERVSDLEKTTSNDFVHQLAFMNERIDETNKKLDKIDERLRNVENRLTRIETKVC